MLCQALQMWSTYLLAKALSQPALPEGDRQSSAVEDPQRAGDAQQMPARLLVVAVAQGKTSRTILPALLSHLDTRLAQNSVAQVVRPTHHARVTCTGQSLWALVSTVQALGHQVVLTPQ